MARKHIFVTILLASSSSDTMNFYEFTLGHITWTECIFSIQIIILMTTKVHYSLYVNQTKKLSCCSQCFYRRSFTIMRIDSIIFFSKLRYFVKRDKNCFFDSSHHQELACCAMIPCIRRCLTQFFNFEYSFFSLLINCTGNLICFIWWITWLAEHFLDLKYFLTIKYNVNGIHTINYNTFGSVFFF